jgi:hypothetical protein
VLTIFDDVRVSEIRCQTWPRKTGQRAKRRTTEFAVIITFLSDAIHSIVKWIPLAVLLVPFIVGFLVGAAFTRYIRWRGWPPKVISMLPISVMFGTLSYVVTPAIIVIVLEGFAPGIILAGVAMSIFYTWPLWLVMGPVFFIYIAQIKRRNRWLKNSTVYYLSAVSFVAEGAFTFLFFRH